MIKFQEYLELFAHPLAKSLPRLYRVVLEKSNMSNNMEVALFLTQEQLSEEFASSERVALIRPIHCDEPQYPNPHEMWRPGAEERVAPLTRQLDDVYKTIGAMRSLRQMLREPTPANMLGHYIGNNFYDCMSGGMGTTAVILCRELINQLPKSDWKTSAYLETTLEDFMRETAKHAAKSLPCGLPSLTA